MVFVRPAKGAPCPALVAQMYSRIEEGGKGQRSKIKSSKLTKLNGPGARDAGGGHNTLICDEPQQPPLEECSQ